MYQWEGYQVTVTSYLGVIGDNQMGGAGTGSLGYDCHGRIDCLGMFFRNSYQAPVTFNSVTDGLSNTFMIGENMPEQNYHSTAFYANGDYGSCHYPINSMFNQPGNWPIAMTFRSRHVTGAHFCLADGSVRYVASSIDFNTYRAACTRNWGEALQLP
jgi:hypothetical protein